MENNENKFPRADRAMLVAKVIMWIVGIFNLLMSAALVFAFICGDWDKSAFDAILGKGLGSFLWDFIGGRLIYLLLYWIFILPASSGFGLGTAIFFLRDQKRIGRFDKSCVVFIALFSLSLVPGIIVLGSLIAHIFN